MMNTALNDQDRDRLLALVHEVVAHGTTSESRFLVNPEEYSDAVRAPRAAFVSVYVDGKLRGCTGELEARGSLLDSVVHNAHTAAFRDHRFPPVRAEELSRLGASISVLAPQVPIDFSSEEDLIHSLVPGVDGLTIRAQNKQATFLPTVWDSLPNPTEFLAHLKHKAGLPQTPCPGLQAWRYRTENFKDATLTET